MMSDENPKWQNNGPWGVWGGGGRAEKSIWYWLSMHQNLFPPHRENPNHIG